MASHGAQPAARRHLVSAGALGLGAEGGGECAVPSVFKHWYSLEARQPDTFATVLQGMRTAGGMGTAHSASQCRRGGVRTQAVPRRAGAIVLLGAQKLVGWV